MTETGTTRRDGETKMNLLPRIPTRLLHQEEATRVLLEEELELKLNLRVKPSLTQDLRPVTRQEELQAQGTVVLSSNSSRRVLNPRCPTLKAS